MASRFTPGDTVQTRFGHGVVRDVRNNGWTYGRRAGASAEELRKDLAAAKRYANM
jgi:hypothetical protein